MYYSCDDEKLKRNVKFINSSYLDIEFDQKKYDNLDEEQQKKVKIVDNNYILPVDFLIGFHNGTPGIVRTAPSTNIETINELPYCTDLKPLPDEIKQQLEFVNDKTLGILKKIKNGKYIPTQYTEQQIDKVKRYIKYLDINRFHNMSDFSKVTRCIHSISDTLIDEFLEKCKCSKLWKEQTSLEWCTNFFNNADFKSIGYGTFCYMLQKDDKKKFKEFIKEKEIIKVDDIISRIEHVDLDNYNDEKGYLKEIPNDKPFLAIQSPLGSGKTYQIKKLIEKHGVNKKIILVVGRCSLGMEFTYNIFKNLGFEYYKDKTNLTNCKRLVIQVDSLCKLFTIGSSKLDNIFDWLIVDEAELIADRLCEISKNKNECIFYFNWCIKNCKKVVLSDGQLSQNLINILSDVRNEKPFIIRNTFNKNAQIKHTVYHELRNNKQMDKFNYVLQQAINEVKNNKKLYITCNEKTTALSLKKEFDKFTDNAYVFTGDTLEPEKRRLCMNLNEQATKYDVFITTSVLLAGNSIDMKHFDKCYVFIGDRTDNPRNVHQMIKRVRHLKDNEIICHIAYSEYIDHKYDMTDIHNWMMSTGQYMNEPNNWLNCFDYNKHGILEHKKTMIFDLFSRYKYQQMNKHCYSSWYIGLCNENKYIVDVKDHIVDTSCEVNINDTRMQVSEEEYINIANAKLPTESEYDERKKCVCTALDHYKIEKFILAGNFYLLDKPEAHADTIDDLEFIRKYFNKNKRKKYKFLRAVAYTADTYEMYIEHVNKKIKDSHNDELNRKYYHDIELYQKIINALNIILNYLGYKNFGDLDGRVVDGITLKNCFEKNKTEILKTFSILLYQLKLSKKDISGYDFNKFIRLFNVVLEELTSGKFINVSDSKKHDIKYKQYQFIHEFMNYGDNVVHEAVQIKFKPFELCNCSAKSCLIDDDDNDSIIDDNN